MNHTGIAVADSSTPVYDAMSAVDGAPVSARSGLAAQAKSNGIRPSARSCSSARKPAFVENVTSV